MNATTRRFNAEMLNDPFFIGFDTVLNKLHHGHKNTSNYPPYNLIKAGDDTYLIELAVAGFDEEDFDIEIHDGVLTIRADVGDIDRGVDYLHKGIAARSFERKFTLADTIEIQGVTLNMGLLTVKLQNVIPEEKKPKKIPISSSDSKKLLSE
jgi:molecular chaperone IbpA